MIINNGLQSKETLLDSYPADSIVLINKYSKEKVNGQFISYNKTDAISVLKNRADHQFLVQFLTGNHKGEIYTLRYNKSSRDDGSVLKYPINQEKLLASSNKLPNELQASIQTINDTKVILTIDISMYLKLLNQRALETSVNVKNQTQPE